MSAPMPGVIPAPVFSPTRRPTPSRFCPGRLRLTLNRSSDLGPSSAVQPFRRDA